MLRSIRGLLFPEIPKLGEKEIAKLEEKATQSQTATSAPKAFQPGDKLHSLPPHLHYLNHAVYVADNEDDSILVVSLEPYRLPISWSEFNREVSDVNRDWAKATDPQMRIGTEKDWNTLLKSDFVDRAELFKPPQPGPEPNYWQESPRHKIRGNFRTVRNPHSPEKTYLLDAQNGRAFGRRFADVPRIELGL